MTRRSRIEMRRPSSSTPSSHMKAELLYRLKNVRNVGTWKEESVQIEDTQTEEDPLPSAAPAQAQASRDPSLSSRSISFRLPPPVKEARHGLSIKQDEALIVADSQEEEEDQGNRMEVDIIDESMQVIDDHAVFIDEESPALEEMEHEMAETAHPTFAGSSTAHHQQAPLDSVEDDCETQFVTRPRTRCAEKSGIAGGGTLSARLDAALSAAASARVLASRDPSLPSRAFRIPPRVKGTVASGWCVTLVKHERGGALLLPSSAPATANLLRSLNQTKKKGSHSKGGEEEPLKVRAARPIQTVLGDIAVWPTILPL